MGLVVHQWPSDNTGSEEEIVRKFGVWKREMETKELKISINKTKFMVMGREPAVRPQRER